MLISEAFEKYINEEIIGLGGSLNTCSAYHYALKAFIAEWGDIAVENITLELVSKFRVSFLSDAKTKTKYHSTGTVRDYLVYLRSVIKICKSQGLNVIDPETIKLPKRDKKVPLCLEECDVQRLIDAANQPCRGYPAINRFRNVLIIKMLYATGLRISELCRLNIEDIHDREFVVIGKSKEPRPCYITEEVEEMIKEYIKMRNDNNPALFVSAQTGSQRLSPKTVQLMFRRIRRQLMIGKATPHTLRHSYCTKLLDCGVDIRHTAKLMGHQSWDTTKIYTHIKDWQLRE